ncbi:NAD(P)-binding Rossmann-fold containing protein [Glarea lozoyensis ATCC 20868]|uniref:NAD(P)-binding Rossmann-fold containing protein n=1 Tax=Glarea lozoyensis (strain ATCC 20868 / MF5171) TaxID=1116229 RepID=S3CWA2_GLAL2|nr:NAD(P)-binding Rossmann-fold containing protein [Glarea lozoyensis ATCC 20868]EPE29905.1 NAD(P)-binding Rossmann-fold containing protein [Glarea lozoyensis ATCC 20868]
MKEHISEKVVFGKDTTGAEVAERFRDGIQGRCFLITGVSPNSLGTQLAHILANHAPSHILLASRTPSNLQEVKNTILSQHPHLSIQTFILDLSSLSSVRTAASEIIEYLKKKRTGIDVMFNNAGINISTRHLSPEGHELQFATNVLGPYLLTKLLLPFLTTSSSPYQTRVVNTSSEAHRISPIRFSDLRQEPGRFWDVPLEEMPRKGLPEGMLRGRDGRDGGAVVDGGYEGNVGYGMSKTGNILHVLRLRGMGVGAWSVNPGSSYPLILLFFLLTFLGFGRRNEMIWWG